MYTRRPKTALYLMLTTMPMSPISFAWCLPLYCVQVGAGRLRDPLWPLWPWVRMFTPPASEDPGFSPCPRSEAFPIAHGDLEHVMSGRV